MKRAYAVVLTSILLPLLAIAGLGTLVGAEEGGYSRLEKLFYLPKEEAVWIRPGLNLEILNVTIPESRKPVVTFKITDDRGQPLDREGIFTPGSVSTSFVLSYIPADQLQYTAYTTRAQTSPITGVRAIQPASDSGGRYDSLGDGMYTYTFGTTLPVSYDRSLTHTLGIYSTRDLREFGLSRYVANPLRDFVPDGRAVTKVRRVVATQNCNQCHNPLGLHGGSRRETGLCILCHQPQNFDPDTGNTVDLKVMVHKIHMGEELPSVQAGKPYQIIGVRQTVFDFSEIAFPRDIRNCATCHQNTEQAENYALNPTRAACGSCHDNVDFRSGEHHPGGAQPDDTECSRCHFSRAAREYDASVPGAHTVPYKSAQLTRPKFEFVSITNTGAGKKPVVQFKITDKNGDAIAPSAMARIFLRLAGPTSDYSWFILENVAGAAYANGVGTYSFTGSIPSGATGTYSIGVEGYVNSVLNPGTTKELTYRDAVDNVVKYFAVTGTLAPRRSVVDISKCNQCHDKLQLHGNNRNNTEYCIGCHNPTMTDAARRPAAAGPPETIHFKSMIHRIHTGHDLENDWTVYGFGNTAHNYNELHFPGDRRDCETCHVGDSYTLPVPSSSLPTNTPRWFWNPTGPTAAACLGCHDSVAAAAHAYVNTAVFGESCAVCHREGAEFAVSRMHAR